MTERMQHLTPGDLAIREQVPIKTVYMWNYKGSGPKALSIGRHVRYRLADVLAWEASRVKERP